jgi:hypothetical protein
MSVGSTSYCILLVINRDEARSFEVMGEISYLKP